MDKPLFRKHSKINKIKRRYGDLKKKRALSILNLATCTAAFNDNLFKLLTIYLLIDIKGVDSASDVALMAGIFYVLPFLMFSGFSGALADPFSKQKIIVWMKAFEVAIIALGFYVYINQIVWGCYFCVFLLSLQSAIMSPPKYSIIMELVKKEQVAKANSYVTSYTYISIIMGTFMASFLTDRTGKNFVLSLSVCMIAALVGYFASLSIPKTEGMGVKIPKKQPPFSQIKDTLQMCKKTPKLLLVVIGSAFFLFVGAFLQLNLIPFAISSLGMDEVGGGYLFLGTSLGIAAGSIISGKLCKKQVHLGIPALAMLGMAIFVLSLPIVSGSLALVIMSLCFIGLFGGLYQIPLESYMQSYCSPEKRGKVVAAANFLSFAGVLLAPLSMGVFEKVLRLSPAAGFVMLGLILLTAGIVLAKSLFMPMINFISKRIFHKFYDVYYQEFPFAKKYEEQRVAVFIKGLKKRFVFLLCGETMQAQVFIIRQQQKKYDRFMAWINGVDILYLNEELSAKVVREKISGLLTKTRPLFLLDEDVDLSELKELIAQLRSEYHFNAKEMELVNRIHFRPSLDHIWQKTALVFSFNCIKKEKLINESKPEIQLV